MPITIDETARDEPQLPWASLPFDDDDLSKGYEDITYDMFANAINKLAWHIEKAIGRSSTFDTVAYLGAPDVRYHIMQMAVIKTGHKVLFSSLLNTTPAHVLLMAKTKCTALFSSAGFNVKDVLASRPMPHSTIPELNDLLDLSDRAEHYPYTKTFSEAENDPYLIIHTSGSTGDPKPIVKRHRGMAATNRQACLPDIDGIPHNFLFCRPGEGVRMLMPSAPYHGGSALGVTAQSILGRSVLVPGFRHRLLEPKDICHVLDHARITKFVLMPWMMEEIARRPDGEEYMKRVDLAYFGGATLSPYAANKWAKHTRIGNFWGSTECAAPPQLQAPNEDHEYIYWDTKHAGIEFRPVRVDSTAADGAPETLYEMVRVLTPLSARYTQWPEKYDDDDDGRVVIPSEPPYPKFPLGNLWTPHPDPAKAAYAWRFAGRTDDLVTFATGINLRPGPLEDGLLAHADVAGALLVGNGRRQPLALLELAPGVAEHGAAARIWRDVVAPLNASVPAHGRVAETHVVAVPSGSFVRTPKGSYVRRKTEEKFAGEIQEVYEVFGDHWQEADDAMPKTNGVHLGAGRAVR
ncbi:acetyl-CoA synthetase-like protein [Xylariomycetidae sp. FL0641]|nr:acetyl-CoA synthetase-like protein [Xylariomycetidae sp. FL0641]